MLTGSRAKPSSYRFLTIHLYSPGNCWALPAPLADLHIHVRTRTCVCVFHYAINIYAVFFCCHCSSGAAREHSRTFFLAQQNLPISLSLSLIAKQTHCPLLLVNPFWGPGRWRPYSIRIHNPMTAHPLQVRSLITFRILHIRAIPRELSFSFSQLSTFPRV